MKERIFLIGFMGVGKSSFGKRLAKKMNWSFLDSDREIEKESGLSVEALFNKVGEEGFRQLETEWLEQCQQEKVIIALGGGTPCHNDNMDLILQKGKSIYLELEPKVLVDRLQNSKTTRPLIQPFLNDSEVLERFIEDKLKEREVFYLQANHKVSGMGWSAKRVEELVELLKA